MRPKECIVSRLRNLLCSLILKFRQEEKVFVTFCAVTLLTGDDELRSISVRALQMAEKWLKNYTLMRFSHKPLIM
jgi:hypothetical protein